MADDNVASTLRRESRGDANDRRSPAAITTLIPTAKRIDTQRLPSVVGIPFAAAIAMATAVAATGGDTGPLGDAGGLSAGL